MLATTFAPTIQVFAYEAPTVVTTVQPESYEAQKARAASTVRNVMYYGDWSIWGGQGNFYPKDIPADQLTHLNFAFMDFDANGDLVFTDKDAAVGAPVGQEGVQWGAANAGILIALQELREKNPNLKLGISVGGWSKSGDFSTMAANATARANFIANIIQFVEYTNMDFIDLDWEFPGEVREGDLVDNKNDEGTPNASAADKANYITLLEELRAAMDEKGIAANKYYELTVALPAPKAKVDKGIDVDALFNVVDFANIMTYDLRGAWDSMSGHQTALYNEHDPMNDNNLSIDESVDYLLAQGAPADKIVIGAAFYTRGWNEVAAGDNAELPGLFQPATLSGKDADQTPSYGAPNEAPMSSGDGGRAAGAWTYNGLDKLKATYPGLVEYWDEAAQAPYLYDATTGKFFTYDNARSITAKADYVLDNNLGGMIGWMASQDASTDGTARRDELTTAMKEGLFGQAELPTHEIIYEALDVAVSISTFTQDWGTGGGYEITITNNEKAEESNSVLKEVERGSETIKAPKLYIKSDSALARGDHMAGTVTYENGYTVVDLQSVWEGKNIEQGQTYTFKLSGDATIESIELVQRMSTNGPEMYRQTIFGETSEKPEVNTAPVFTGLANKTITIGEAFDALAGVKAMDKEDGDLTSQIVVSGSVDSAVVGAYTVTYSATDSQGLTTTVSRVINVEAEVTPEPEVNTAPVFTGVANTTIQVGQAFDALAGVKATDKEDGDLTSQIQVAGSVDANVEGTYTLTYTVTDSQELTTTATRVITVQAQTTEDNLDFNVGQGIQWPSQVNAPFVDMTAWVGDSVYGNSGAANLAKLSLDTDVQFFNLGFIQAASNTIKDGKVEWGFGGYSVLNEANNTNSQYQGIKQSIRELREIGGDVTISLGGLSGTAIWEVTSDVDVLYNTYLELVDGFNLTRLDLDIEGAAQNKAKNVANAKAIKMLQDATGVDIVLTLPVLPSGLTAIQLDVLEAYLSEGVDVEVVNLMTMCYGNGTLLPGENYGTASLRAVDSTMEQLKTYFAKYANVTLTTQQAYAKIGTTPSIGFEGSAHPIFTTEWSQLVVDHAIEKGLAMTSFWSMNRDAMLENNQGVSTKYAFTNIFKNFGTTTENPNPEVNTAPTFSGVANKTITVGDTFDALAGVKATDKEDGDLTSQIKVSGTVDSTVAGTYTLTYTVTDSKGLTTTAT
ncbi:MAG: glycosyl hydrolase family 18 protein, partial [Culicoidibacterales bacterium]